jgi:hypothetical protein
MFYYQAVREHIRPITVDPIKWVTDQAVRRWRFTDRFRWAGTAEFDGLQQQLGGLSIAVYQCPQYCGYMVLVSGHDLEHNPGLVFEDPPAAIDFLFDFLENVLGETTFDDLLEMDQP